MRALQADPAVGTVDRFHLCLRSASALGTRVPSPSLPVLRARKHAETSTPLPNRRSSKTIRRADCGLYRRILCRPACLAGRTRTPSSSSACRAPAQRLLEQILASHPGRRHAPSCPTSSRSWPPFVAVTRSRQTRATTHPHGADCRGGPALGERYLDGARLQPHRQNRFFSSTKMPNNLQAPRTDPPETAERQDHRRRASRSHVAQQPETTVCQGAGVHLQR